jgi:hypothetical protein
MTTIKEFKEKGTPSFALGAAIDEDKRAALKNKKFPKNLSRTWGDYFSVYDTERFRRMWELAESELYGEYTKIVLTNPMGNFVLKGLDDAIFGPGYHFEGDEAAVKKLKAFWRENKMTNKLEKVVLHTATYGNGYFFIDEGEGGQPDFLDLHGASVFFREDGTMYQEVKQQELGKTIELNPNKIIHFKFFDLGNTYYGMSLFRPNLPFVWGIFDATGDILQAIKRAAYAPVVAYLDLDSIPSKTEKDNAIKDFGDMLHSVVSASTNYVVDKKHELNMLSAGGGQGSGLNLPVNDLLSPILSILLLNFNISSAVFGNTKGIDPELQDLFTRRGIHRLKGKLKETIDNDIIPLIVGDADVQIVWDLSDSEMRFNIRMLLDAYTAGVVSREFVLDEMNWVDDGKVFNPQPGKLGGGLDSG